MKPATNTPYVSDDACILPSALWTDLYKITMQEAVLHHYPNQVVRYEFINRGGTEFPPGFAEQLQKQVELYAQLEPTEQEIIHLSKRCDYLKEDYLEWLFRFRPNPEDVYIRQEGSKLFIEIQGPWYRTIVWEVPLMAMICALYYEMMGLEPTGNWEERTAEKARIMFEAGANVIEFGTRRAFHPTKVHERVLRIMIEVARDIAGMNIPGAGTLIGTSNIALATKYGLTPFGTYAHEWDMAHAGMFGYKNAYRKSMGVWSDEFDARLGVALSDAFTTDVFLRSFTGKFAKLFDGVRHDSGDPFKFTDKIIAHYQSLKINPLHKRITFSDSLNVELVLKLVEYCRDRIQCSFGIGTHLTNDVGHKPLNIVIKLVAVQYEQKFFRVAKLSDNPGKHTGGEEAVAFAKYDLMLDDKPVGTTTQYFAKSRRTTFG